MTQYIVWAWDYTDAQALDRRMAARSEHLEKAKALKQQGKLIVAGAMLDEQQKMIGSTLILQLDSPQELEEWQNNEPYLKQKVWEKIEIRPIRLAQLD